jgi:hypothetical protein
MLATADAPPLSLRRSNDALDLSWPATTHHVDGSVVRPSFEVQRSLDLRLWRPLAEPLRAGADTTESALHLTLDPRESLAFYRLLSVDPPPVTKLGVGGEEVFGYVAAFERELKRIGQISPEQFGAMFASTPTYLPGVSWDPTTAAFWDKFNLNPDSRLNQNELTLYKQNGFVVSERLGADSFGAVFYNLWHADLPVFISTDALLQAWHRTFDPVLEETEETYLFTSVDNLLSGMAAQLSVADQQAGQGVLRDSLLDADYYLAVARSLLAGLSTASVLGQDARVAATLADVQAEQLRQIPDFMGFCRVVDFSQFKPRGHYTHSERLARYFQCLIWLGRIDVPVAGTFARCPDDTRKASPRELGFSIVLWHLLNASGQFDTWAEMERIISTFVGQTDSLTFGQLNGLFAGAGVGALADVRDAATLDRIQNDIISGELSVQNIRSDWFDESLEGAGRPALPQTFTVFGQKFVPDSWAFSQTVFKSVRVRTSAPQSVECGN